jgi:DMSO/TMAO reductase YedYZ molybdopterin-dependent catalytic subunit
MGWLAPAVAALAAQWALHLAVPRAPFAPFSLGEWLVRQAPGGLATAAIELFGHQALHMVAVLSVAGALALAVVLRRAAPAVLGGVALVSSLGAGWLDPRRPGPAWALAAAAVAALAAILAALAAATRPGRQQPMRPAGRVADPGRRRLLAGIALGAGSAVLGGAAARRALQPARAGLVIADRPAAVPHDPGFAGIAGLSPAVTPTPDHYVVDIDLTDPAAPGSGWALRVDGAVTRPLQLTLADLRAMPTVERLMAMCCISNPVGGPLVGNARWTGVPLADLLRQAGPTAAAVAVEAVAADGYRETYPLPALADQDVLVAFGMNGAELPQQHGYPARLLVPGHYGMKSVKWLTRLALLRAPAAGYWEQRGWDPVATIRTQSRIDTPADHAAVPPRFTVAGIAWAGDRRVARMQVLVDDHGPWRPAVLEREADPLGWRRWRLGLQLPAGLHTLTVRAVDGTGQVQAAERLPPHPSGASGYHRIVVRVRPA